MSRRITRNTPIIMMNSVEAVLVKASPMERKARRKSPMERMTTTIFQRMRLTKELEESIVYQLYNGYRSNPKTKSLR